VLQWEPLSAIAGQWLACNQQTRNYFGELHWNGITLGAQAAEFEVHYPFQVDTHEERVIL
jgi:hypothetical protein